MQKNRKLTREDRERALTAQGISTGIKTITARAGQTLFDGGADETERTIAGGGVIGQSRLYRRWIVSQTFHMLTRCNDMQLSYAQAISGKSARYQWRMLADECEAQAEMQRHGDGENMAMRRRFFNGRTLADIVEDYVRDLKKEMEENRQQSEGDWQPTYRLRKDNRMQRPTQWTMDRHLDDMCKTADLLRQTGHPDEILMAMRHVKRKAYDISDDNWQPMTWRRAYMQAGVYFTLRQLILFKGCTLPGTQDGDDQLKALDRTRCDIGTLLDTLIKNNIDIRKEMQSWRSR